jgi:hypothetical protein
MAAALTAAACGGMEIGAGSTDSGSTDSGTIGPGARYAEGYFYCVVEPEILMGGLSGKACGDDGSHGCHYSADVAAMSLVPLSKPVVCSGSGTSATPTDPSQVGAGSMAAANYQAVSLTLTATYTETKLYLAAEGMLPGHPVVLSPAAEAEAADILRTWATGL